MTVLVLADPWRSLSTSVMVTSGAVLLRFSVCGRLFRCSISMLGGFSSFRNLGLNMIDDCILQAPDCDMI